MGRSNSAEENVVKSGARGFVRSWSSLASVLAPSLVVYGLSFGCGEAGDPWESESYDERDQPLGNAIIGTPDGVVVLGAPGEDDVGFGGRPGAGSSGPVSAGGGVIIGGGASGGGSSVEPAAVSGFGSWSFDDCSPDSRVLADGSGSGLDAQQLLDATCVPGISGQAIELNGPRDVIQLPDSPQLALDSRIAVAAWVKPNTVQGNQPIVLKRQRDQTAFSLAIRNGNIEMSVVLDSGTTVLSRAPIAAGEFSHVAGLFDGTFVFLFINGQQFGQVYGAGTLRDVAAPIRIGATSQSQYFDGVIDEVFVSTDLQFPGELMARACIEHPSTFTVSPESSGPVPPETTVAYDVAVTNHDVGFCQERFINAFVDFTDSGLDASFGQGFASVAAGDTAHLTALVTGNEDVAPGIYELPFQLFSSGSLSFDELSGTLVYELVPPTGCFVSSRRELLIRHLSVVDDPVRTAGNQRLPSLEPPFPGPIGGTLPPPAASSGSGGGAGVWSFAHLMRELAPSAADAPRMVEQMLQTFTTEQVINGFTVVPRPGMQSLILNGWPRTDNGELDLEQAPVTLLAIVNRIDVRDLAAGSGGEGRFVFGVNSRDGFPLQFTLIFEFNLPAQTQQDVQDWADRWHALQSHPFPSEQYNAALEDITRRFTSRGSSPGSINGSALNSFRTNEIDLGEGAPWELRQFDLDPGTGLLSPVPLADTPDLSFNDSSTFGRFVNQNAEAIQAVVPGGPGNLVGAEFEGARFQAGSVFNNLGFWSAPNITDPDARFHASLNTCNGCHGPETNSGFLMINPRFGEQEASLAPFISGTTVIDPFSGQARQLNDLARRRVDLTALVCPPGTVVPQPPLLPVGPTPVSPPPFPPPPPATPQPALPQPALD